MEDSFVGPYESTPESIKEASPDTPPGWTEPDIPVPDSRATSTKKLVFLYVGRTGNAANIPIDYMPYTAYDIAGFGGVTEYVLCAGNYYGYREGGFEHLVAAMKNTLTTIKNQIGASARIWISTPAMEEPKDDGFNYPAWTNRIKTYINALRSASGFSVSDWNSYVKGLYMHSERIFGAGTAFNTPVNYNNLLAHPQIKLYSDIGAYIRTPSGAYNAKELLWCPYYGFGTYAATIIKDIGYVANTTNIFNTVLLQPTYYFGNGPVSNVDAIREKGA